MNTALYGFTESPSDWGDFRDKGLKEMTWTESGNVMRFQATGESNLWRVLRNEECEGYMTVYVDDLLVATNPRSLRSVFKAIQRQWDCSEPDFVENGPIRYCGYDIKKIPGGFQLSQGNYVRDLLKRRQVEGTESVPMTKIEEEEDETGWTASDLKEAQTITGELSWIAQRTRPDLAYTVGLMSRMIHRRPCFVARVGAQVLKYLNKDPDKGLKYLGGGELGTLTAYADASYGPVHEKYRSVHGVLLVHGKNILQWESGRQGFVTQSTAEAELVAYNEAFQAGEAIASLLEILEFSCAKRLRGDSKAALSLCTQEVGHWRTRHLRLRAAKVREAIQELQTWSAEHVHGTELVADGLTKALQGQAYHRFVELLGMKGGVEEPKRRDPVGNLREQAVSGLAALAGCYAMRRMWTKSGMLAVCAGILRKIKVCSRRSVVSAGQTPVLRSMRPVEDDEVELPVYSDSEEDRRYQRAMREELQFWRTSSPEDSPQEEQSEDDSEGSEHERRVSSGHSWSEVGHQQSRGSGAAAPGEDGASPEAEPEPEVSEIWNAEKYMRPPTGGERWSAEHSREGWLVRSHGHQRQRPFMPVLATLPIRGDQLLRRRITVVFDRHGREVIQDRWTDPRPWSRVDWRGYTFIQCSLEGGTRPEVCGDDPNV